MHKSSLETNKLKVKTWFLVGKWVLSRWKIGMGEWFILYFLFLKYFKPNISLD